MKQVEGYENYVIYQDGRLWSRNVGRFLTPFPISRRDKVGNKEYMAYKLCKNGEEKTFQVHRLVAIHYIPNPEGKPEVNHKDGNKLNNCVENLEWVTHSENVLHAFEAGLNDGRMWEGERHARSTYTNEEVKLLCELFSQGVIPKHLAKSTTKEYQKLFRIWNRDNWKHISKDYVW